MKATCLAAVTALPMLAGAALAQTGIPDLSHCESWLAHDGPETPTLMVQPSGQGSAFTEAQLPDGTRVDATVFLRMLDNQDFPICCFPREDLWLQSEDGGLIRCGNGTIADANTDAAGLTHWTAPLHAGGSSQALLWVHINGEALWTGGLPLSINSPDFNGDLRVNLADVQLFAADLAAGYDFRTDLHRDGVLNLADLGRLAASLGAQCP